jgi:hypothetical protein
VARDDQREAVRGAKRPGRALRVRMPGQRRHLAVARRLAVRDRPDRFQRGPLEGRAPVELELHVDELVALSPKVAPDPLGQRMLAVGAAASHGQLVPGEQAVREDQLPSSPAGHVVGHSLDHSPES